MVTPYTIAWMRCYWDGRVQLSTIQTEAWSDLPRVRLYLTCVCAQRPAITWPLCSHDRCVVNVNSLLSIVPHNTLQHLHPSSFGFSGLHYSRNLREHSYTLLWFMSSLHKDPSAVRISTRVTMKASLRWGLWRFYRLSDPVKASLRWGLWRFYRLGGRQPESQEQWEAT